VFTARKEWRRVKWLVDVPKAARVDADLSFAPASSATSRAAFFMQLLVLAKNHIGKGVDSLEKKIRGLLMRRVQTFKLGISKKFTDLVEVMKRPRVRRWCATNSRFKMS
jgi:hypothetical protein